jgi:hypothetical protein
MAKTVVRKGVVGRLTLPRRRWRRLRRRPESVKYALDSRIFIDSFRREDAQLELLAF